MDSPSLKPVGVHARRAQRWALVFVAYTVLAAAKAALNARTNWHSALDLLFLGMLMVLGSRGLRANSALIQLTDPPTSKWIAWAAGAVVGVGVMAIVFGGAWLAITLRGTP